MPLLDFSSFKTRDVMSKKYLDSSIMQSLNHLLKLLRSNQSSTPSTSISAHWGEEVDSRVSPCIDLENKHMSIQQNTCLISATKQKKMTNRTATDSTTIKKLKGSLYAYMHRRTEILKKIKVHHVISRVWMPLKFQLIKFKDRQ